MPDQPISSLMSPNVISVQADDTIATVSAELLRHGLSFMPVTDRNGSTLLGVISTDDLLKFREAKRDPEAVQAWEVCTYRPVEAGPDTPAREVARMMVEGRIHHVIVTSNKEVLGVVSSLDFLRQYASGG